MQHRPRTFKDLFERQKDCLAHGSISRSKSILLRVDMVEKVLCATAGHVQVTKKHYDRAIAEWDDFVSRRPERKPIGT
jgi:hypothetical protein